MNKMFKFIMKIKFRNKQKLGQIKINKINNSNLVYLLEMRTNYNNKQIVYLLKRLMIKIKIKQIVYFLEKIINLKIKQLGYTIEIMT